MSAKAPAGKVNRKNGKDATVDINDKNNADAPQLVHHPGCSEVVSRNTSPGEYTCEPKFSNTVFRRAVKVEVFSKLLLIGALHFSAGFGKNTKLLTLTSPSFQNQKHLVVRLTMLV
jgi:hypothetical protein